MEENSADILGAHGSNV